MNNYCTINNTRHRKGFVRQRMLVNRGLMETLYSTLSNLYFMFQRIHFHSIVSRLSEPKKFIQVVMGPRQVGKTTLVTQVLKALSQPSSFESADGVSSSERAWLEQIWQNARIRMQQLEAPEYILAIDEIQKIDNWSEMVKQLWDEDAMQGRALKVVLLGSSRLLIQQELTESLAVDLKVYT